MSLRAGDWVQVRSKQEILQTLDERGRFENMPFMPQMFDFCGQRFRVSKRAHKTCDTVNGTGGRSLPNGIHLENLRCNGQAYGGCQAACLIFWKEAWLQPVSGSGIKRDLIGPQSDAIEPRASMRCSEAKVLAGTLAQEQPTSGGPKYSCQATDLPKFTSYLPWWDARQYVEDYKSGNVSLAGLVSGFIYASYYYLSRPGRNPMRAPFRRLYDRTVGLWGGVPFPRYGGKLRLNQPTPISKLDLQPGELVRVKSYQAILETIDKTQKNRGLFFDAEMVPYCGHTFRVRSRVSRFLNEQTGLMVTLRTPAVILDGVWCRSRYSDRRMMCPRSIYSWWREVWLERVNEKPSRTDATESAIPTTPVIACPQPALAMRMAHPETSPLGT
jgi:hypothetical protein